MTEHDEIEARIGASRRTLLRGAAIAGLAVPVLAACGGSSEDDSSSAGDDASSSDPDPSTPGGSSKSGGSGGSAGSGADVLAKTSEVPNGSGIIVGDTTAGTIITQPDRDEFNGFVNKCKHQGCPLGSVTDTINCNCHGSQYDLDGTPVTGPNGQPASTITALDPVSLDVKGGNISKA